MRKLRKIEIISLIGLVLAIGVTLFIANGGIKQTDQVKPPSAFRWYSVSGAFTPEVCLLELDLEEFDLDWLNQVR